MTRPTAHAEMALVSLHAGPLLRPAVWVSRLVSIRGQYQMLIKQQPALKYKRILSKLTSSKLAGVSKGDSCGGAVPAGPAAAAAALRGAGISLEP